MENGVFYLHGSTYKGYQIKINIVPVQFFKALTTILKPELQKERVAQ
jgi:hypothetical protein